MARVREEKRRIKKIREEKESEERRCKKSRETMCFPMFCRAGGSKSRLAKAPGAEPSGHLGR